MAYITDLHKSLYTSKVSYLTFELQDDANTRNPTASGATITITANTGTQNCTWQGTVSSYMPVAGASPPKMLWWVRLVAPQCVGTTSSFVANNTITVTVGFSSPQAKLSHSLEFPTSIGIG